MRSCPQTGAANCQNKMPTKGLTSVGVGHEHNSIGIHALQQLLSQLEWHLNELEYQSSNPNQKQAAGASHCRTKVAMAWRLQGIASQCYSW